MTTTHTSRLRPAAMIIGAVLGGYLVVRGIAEFFLIDYGDPASYRPDWGGPSLLGVLAVHSGPAALILGYLAFRVRAFRARAVRVRRATLTAR